MKRTDNFFPKESETPSVFQKKKELRAKLRVLRRSLALRAEPFAWGPRQFLQALAALQMSYPDFQAAQRNRNFLVACYFPVKDELDLTSFAEKNWLFPKMTEEKKLLWFFAGDGQTGYHVDRFGLKEKGSEHCFPYHEGLPPLLCFVPGLAGSYEQDRLGYGFGCYDSFLKEHGKRVTSVLCLPSRDFLFPNLPHDDNDAKVDFIVT